MWVVVLGGGALPFFSNTILILGIQKVTPLESWYKAASQIEAWVVFCAMFLGAADT